MIEEQYSEIDNNAVVYTEGSILLIAPSASSETTFLDAIQTISIESYTQDSINKLQKIFEADKKVLELLNQQQKDQKKPNIARKTAKSAVSGSIQINESGHGIEGIINSNAGKDNIDPKASLIQRTQERLFKFGIVNLRTFEIYSLKLVHINDQDVGISPWLQLAKESLKLRQDEDYVTLENEIILQMKDFLNDEMLNPREDGVYVFD